MRRLTGILPRGVPGAAGTVAAVLAAAVVTAAAPVVLPAEAAAQDPPPTSGQEPPPTVRVDSTRLRIQERLKGLARPPGIDSTWFMPDSLLPDSIREAREAARQGGRPQGGRGRADAQGGDSIMAAILGLEDYTFTEYQSQGADFGARTRQLALVGTGDQMARIVSDGQTLSADSALIYDEETGRMWTVGAQAVYQPSEDSPINATRIVFDLNEERGTASGAETKYGGAGAEWLIYGDLRSVSEEALYGHRLQFTTCEHTVPHYHFSSSNVKIEGDFLVARPVTLYFADVPVAWLPFMAQSIKRGRTSGILTPTFSVNDIVRTSQGYSRRVSNIGFYWAMSDYYDASVFMDWWSGEHVALTGAVRYAWTKQFLSGSLNFRRFWEAGGSKQLAFNGNTNWEIGERTKFRFRASYASSSSMIRRTSLNPMEVVQSIDSESGLTHRFSFGNLSISGNRRQYLSDDKVDMTLPNMSFSLSPKTFFQAAPTQARFFNNLTWSGSARYRRSVADRAERPDSVAYSPALADEVRTDAGFNSGLNLGNFSLSTGINMDQTLTRGVPANWSDDLDPDVILSDELENRTSTDLRLNAGLSYQQRLIGSTTLTPNLSFSTRLRRADSDSLAQDFVSAPAQASLSVGLKSELYGFFGGVGPFQAIRHKISPGVDFSYSPEVTPSELQEQVFGAREVGRQRTMRFSLSQTFEAKRKVDSAQAGQATGQPGGGGQGGAQEQAAGAQAAVPDSLAAVGDSLARAPDSRAPGADPMAADTAGPVRREEGEKVVLLALRTTAVNYDFERAAEDGGGWLTGFTTTQITNNVSSDFLRGLTISVAHDIFEDEAVSTGSGSDAQVTTRRKFSPHLSRMNLSFSLNSQSLLVRALGGLLGMGEPDESVVQASDTQSGVEENPFEPSLSDEGSVIPGGEVGRGGRGRPGPGGGGSRGGGGWQASLSYSLQRPRDDTRPSNQMLQGNLSFSPTENWAVSWRTSYDVAAGSFNDHIIRLTRDLHRWEAYFDFTQTATGNWSFRFEVALTDQQDLHFDYHQRTIQDESGRRRF